MIISSATFLLFLILVAAVYYVLPQRMQTAFLLLSSYVFYFWKLPLMGITLPLSTLMSYGTGRAIEAAQKKGSRKGWLLINIIFHLALLACFKYFYGSVQATAVSVWMGGVFASAGALGDLMMTYGAPIGLGFFSLQAIGYTVDVFRKNVSAEKNLIHYALFAGFFTHATSGPIARAGELLPQMKTRHTVCYGNVVEGCQRLLTGAFKKIVVGDSVGLIVNGIYGVPTVKLPLGNLEQYAGSILWLAALLFALQLYADFSGYTDMALGAAKILGFELRENFKAPYLSTSLSGYWKSWHMSLTDWFRDYLYIPLGGSRKGFRRKMIHILIVFMVSGLWHGNTVSYLLWGLFHGLVRIGEELWSKYGPNREKPAGIVIRSFQRAGSYCVWSLSFITFKAERWVQLRYVFTHMFSKGLSFSGLTEQILYLISRNIGATPTYLLLFLGGLGMGILILVLIDYRVYRAKSLYNPLGTYARKARWILYWTMGLLTILFMLITVTVANGSPGFLYQIY